jgi:hypothetical protein
MGVYFPLTVPSKSLGQLQREMPGGPIENSIGLLIWRDVSSRDLTFPSVIQKSSRKSPRLS